MSANGLFSKAVTVGTTRTTGPAQAVPMGYAVRVKAPNGNAGVVHVGEAGVVDTTDGYPLRANEDVLLWVRNLNLIGVVATQASQTVHFLVEK